MDEPHMSELESLALIKSMINKAKNKFSENGHLYLLWGWVVFACSLGHYLLEIQLGYKNGAAIWMLTWLTAFYTIRYRRKRRKTEGVKTYTGQIIGTVWLVFAGLMLVLALVVARLSGPAYFAFINPVLLAIYAIPTILSGVILQFKPLVLGGIACWILSILATYVSPEHHLLFIAGAMVVAWIIPGYLLQKKHKKFQND